MYLKLTLLKNDFSARNNASLQTLRLQEPGKVIELTHDDITVLISGYIKIVLKSFLGIYEIVRQKWFIIYNISQLIEYFNAYLLHCRRCFLTHHCTYIHKRK